MENKIYKLLLLSVIFFGSNNSNAQELTLTNQLSIPFNNNYVIVKDGFKSGIVFDSEENSGKVFTKRVFKE